MKKLLLALALLFAPSVAWAQCNGTFPNNTVCGNVTGSSNLPRPTNPSAFLGAAGGSNGQIQYNNAGALGGFTMGGDCTVSIPNITCTKTNGTVFGPFATGTNAANLTGNLAIARFASGTNAGVGTFWRGDGSWALPFPQIYPSAAVGFVCDGVTDDTPNWNAFMNAVDAGTYAKGTKVQFPYATCMFNSKPRMMASNISLLGSSQINTIFIRNYQPGHIKTVTGVANNGSGTCRVTYTAAGNLTPGTVGVFGVGGVTVANGQWNFTQVDTTHIDLTGCAFSGVYTSGGSVIDAPNDPFIEFGPQSASDCVGFTPTVNPDKCGVNQEMNNFTILSANGTYGGIGLDMGSFNFGGGYGYVYNSKVDHIFVSISGTSGWWVAHQNNGCSSPGSGGVFVGNRDNTVSNSAFYGGVSSYINTFLQCTVASRYLGVNVLQASVPIFSDLVIQGGVANPNYDLIWSASTTNSIVFNDYATISLVNAGNVVNISSSANAVDNWVIAGNCSGTVGLLGTNNVVQCNSNILASSTFVVRSGSSGGVQLTNGATSWAAFSDESLKRNILPKSVLDRLTANVAYSYNWRDSDRHEVGVICQRIREMFPEVTTSIEGKCGVYKDQIGILALQSAYELRKRLDALEARYAK